MNTIILSWLQDTHHLFDYWVAAGPGGRGWACYQGHVFKSKENYTTVRDWLAEQISVLKNEKAEKKEHQHVFLRIIGTSHYEKRHVFQCECDLYMIWDFDWSNPEVTDKCPMMSCSKEGAYLKH